MKIYIGTASKPDGPNGKFGRIDKITIKGLKRRPTKRMHNNNETIGREARRADRREKLSKLNRSRRGGLGKRQKEQVQEKIVGPIEEVREWAARKKADGLRVSIYKARPQNRTRKVPAGAQPAMEKPLHQDGLFRAKSTTAVE